MYNYYNKNHTYNGGKIMTQKELNYMEDIYNHEKLLMDIISSSMEIIDDETYIEMFENQLNTHSEIVNDIEKFAGDCCE